MFRRESVVFWLWKALLAGTAFAPALAVYGGVLLVDREYCMGSIFLVVASGLWTICHRCLRYSMRHSPRERLRPKSVEVADTEALGFLLIYLIPLITKDLSDFNWAAWVIVAIVFVLVVATGHTYHFNPLLVLSGWHFYKVDTEERVKYVLVSRDRIQDAGPRRVGKLTEYVFVDKGVADA